MRCDQVKSRENRDHARRCIRNEIRFVSCASVRPRMEATVGNHRHFPNPLAFFFPKRMTRIKVDNERLRERRCTFGVGPTAGQLKQHMSKWLRYGLCHCVDGTMDARAHGGWSNESPKSYPCHYFATARRSGPACQSISRRSIKAANVIDVKEITFVYNRNYYCICYIVDLIFYQYAH